MLEEASELNKLPAKQSMECGLKNRPASLRVDGLWIPSLAYDAGSIFSTNYMNPIDAPLWFSPPPPRTTNKIRCGSGQMPSGSGSGGADSIVLGRWAKCLGVNGAWPVDMGRVSGNKLETWILTKLPCLYMYIYIRFDRCMHLVCPLYINIPYRLMCWKNCGGCSLK